MILFLSNVYVNINHNRLPISLIDYNLETKPTRMVWDITICAFAISWFEMSLYVMSEGKEILGSYPTKLILFKP